MKSDHELQRLFREARVSEEERVPSFARVLAPRSPRRRPLQVRFVMAVASVVLAAVAVWRLATPNEPRLVIAFVPGEMRVPTDYLLEMATYPRAGDIPRIGASDWFPVLLPLAGDAGPDTRRSP